VLWLVSCAWRVAGWLRGGGWRLALACRLLCGCVGGCVGLLLAWLGVVVAVRCLLGCAVRCVGGWLCCAWRWCCWLVWLCVAGVWLGVGCALLGPLAAAGRLALAVGLARWLRSVAYGLCVGAASVRWLVRVADGVRWRCVAVLVAVAGLFVCVGVWRLSGWWLFVRLWLGWEPQKQ